MAVKLKDGWKFSHGRHPITLPLINKSCTLFSEDLLLYIISGLTLSGVSVVTTLQVRALTMLLLVAIGN